jgi:Arc/MetJ-type ribon-helix-helix transcriptional regulator
MPRITAILSISLPPEMAREVEACCRSEHRTRSELIREALRSYLQDAEIRLQDAEIRSLRIKMERVPEVAPTDEELKAVRIGKAAFRQGKVQQLSAQRSRKRR